MSLNRRRLSGLSLASFTQQIDTELCLRCCAMPWKDTTTDSVQFSHSVVSNSLRPHESQHARPPCPSPMPGVHSDPRPSSQWCHPAISSSVVPFSSCPQSLPASESFPTSQLFAWDGQSTGVSALASFLPKKSQGWFPSEWAGWISYYIRQTLFRRTVDHVNTFNIIHEFYFHSRLEICHIYSLMNDLI